jgi:hypothetical protein
MLDPVRDLRQFFLKSLAVSEIGMRPIVSSYAQLIVVLICCHGSALGEVLAGKVQAGKSWALEVDAGIDDVNLSDPRGYGQHGAATRFFSRRITVTNSGPVPLVGRLLIVDGQDWSSIEKLRASLHLPTEPRLLVERFYNFWKDNRSHAAGDRKTSKDPVGVLNFWGYTLCREDTSALSRFFKRAGIPGRRIPLNGHIVAEYYYDGDWHIVDGDQNVCYLRWDNRTLASAADIAADPLLALRTKVFGKSARISPANSAFNSSLFEYMAPRVREPIQLKTPDLVLREESLLPGEKLIFHSDRSPQKAAGDKVNPEGVRESALCLVEWIFTPSLRTNTQGEMHISSAYPIISVVAQIDGESFAVPSGEPVFDLTIKPKAKDGAISVFCQRSRVSFPRIHKGTTQLAIDAKDSRGEATIEVEVERVPDPPCAVPEVKRRQDRGPLPEFEIGTEPEVDRLWWQVATSAEFDFVPPNFDAICAPAKSLVFDRLTATFFNRDQTYFLRVKARKKGTQTPGRIWGEWSSPVEFQVNMPLRPSAVIAEMLPQGKLHLSWPPASPECEYLVFGSQRLDFVPEIYAKEEIVAMRNGRVEQTRPNKNLVAVLTEAKFESIPEYRYLRIVARKDGALSAPSDLITVPAAIAGTLPPATVLQDRWKRVPDPKAPNSLVDLYLSSELPLGSLSAGEQIADE